MKKLTTLLVTAVVVLAGCSGSSQGNNKDTLNVELPLKTTSLAPYDTDTPVKVGALETLFKSTPDGKIEKVLVKSYKQRFLELV